MNRFLPLPARQTIVDCKTTMLTVLLGLVVGTLFALGKFAVAHGAVPLPLLHWQLSGGALLLAALLLPTLGAARRHLAPRHLAYYLVGGLLGVTLPNLLALHALRELPAGLFTLLATLSPLFTFLIASLINRRLLPTRRLVGILVGLGGVVLATAAPWQGSALSATALLLALAVPALLAVNNLYRERAFPAGAAPIWLAAGTLGSQALALTLLLAADGALQPPPLPLTPADWAAFALAPLAGLSYWLTFELTRRTDGVGFSQVGYFITLTGIAAGALLFGETITPPFAVAVALLFVGMALTHPRRTAPQPATQP